MDTLRRSSQVAAMIRKLPHIADLALMGAAGDYAGVPTEAGGTTAAGSEGIVQRRFTRSNTHGFDPLNEKYKSWKAKRFGSLPILVRTGELRRSLSRARVLRAGRGRVRVVFNVPRYGEYHHRGSGNLPRRSPVEPNAEDRQMVRVAARKHYDGLVRRHAAAAGIKVR